MPATSAVVRIKSSWLLLLLLALLSLWPTPGWTQGPKSEREAVPAELAPWIDWVRDVEPEPGNCRNHADTTICVWPTRAAVVVDEESGSFELELMASEADVLDLIGDDEAWPQDVRVDGKPAVVIDGGGIPQVRVDAGAHRVEGRFVWRMPPSSLRVPEEVALLELVVGGVGITFPSRSGTLLNIPDAGAPDEDEPDEDEPDEDDPDEDEPDAAEPEPDSERIEVSRLIADGVPLIITTRVDLRISGQARELVLPYPVWADAKLVRIDSELPLTLDADERVVLQARSGSYSVTFVAQLPRSPSELGPPPLAEPWPTQEVWIWKAQDEGPGLSSMGQVALSGAAPVDRTRTHAPTDWPEGATYSVTAGTPLRFEVLQRGVAESAPNQLMLTRAAVFDLAGGGWFMLDHITGTLTSGNRLDLQAGALGSVSVGGTPQVITETGDGQAGVELRDPQVDLLAQWRQAGAVHTLPLAGWSETFDGATVEFELPRGWDVLRVSGPGRTSATWLDHWDPLHAILLLGVCLAIGLWIDRKAAVTAAIGLLLLFNVHDDGFVAALVLLAALAGLQFATQRPRGVWPTRILRGLWLLGMFVLLSWVVFVLPEDLEQVWRQGAPALGRLRVDSSDDMLTGGVTVVLAAAGLAWFVALLITRFGGRAPKLVIPFVVVVVVLLGLAGLSLTTRSDKAPSKRAQLEAPPPEEEYEREESNRDEGGTGQRHKGEEGKMGKPGDGHYLASPHGGPFAVGNDDEDVWGGLSGTEVGEAYGAGGLGLVGTGRGGGGTGEGTIGLGDTGLIGKGGGGGTGSGYGRGAGAGFGGRGAAVPQVRQAKAEVNGNLDKDIVRRIVRAHINEVRSCYNAGLTKDPALGGRVEVQFVIADTGKVSSSVVGSTTLGDPDVGKCIALAVKRWTFPKPQGGGEVQVMYPFILESGGEPSDAGGSEAPTRYLSNDQLPDAPPPEIPQTGEAKPDWAGRVWTVTIERSIDQGEQLELTLLSPTANKLIALVRALALLATALLVLFAGWARMVTDVVVRSEPDAAPSSGGSAAAVTIAVLLLAAPNLAWAAPPNELLDELSDRVNRERPPAPEPECGDECALVAKLGVTVSGEELTLEAEVHMAGPGVYILPGPLSAWAPASVTLDGKSAQAIVASDNRLLVRMDEGLHRVVARGPVAGGALNLALDVVPKRVEVTAEGWQVSGVDETDTASNLEFVRERTGSDDGELSEVEPPVSEQVTDDSKTTQDLPVWLVVEREIEIGPRWSVRTTVRRLNAGDNPVKIQVPLLDGEQMIESSRKLEDPKATITLERGDDSITWASLLDTRDRIVLVAPTDGQWTERWVFVCGAAWQCEAEGVPASERSGARSVYYPWPGESLDVGLVKPAPTDGPRLSIDRAELLVQIAEDGSTSVLTASVRTSTVGERTITIPADAHLATVRVDGKEIPVNKDSNEIRLTFQPGTHQLRIEFEQDQGWSSSYATPAVSLGGAAVNAEVRVELDDDLEPVLLRTSGTGFGPTVWLWGWLLALAVVAVLMHRLTSNRAAIKLHDWFLLGFGFPTPALPIVLAWFVMVGQRKRLLARTLDELRYNMIQLGIGLLTLVALALTLVAARALLIDPVSTLPINFHGDELLTWYVDHTDDAMPQGKVLSVSSSLWRVVGLVWVGWFAVRAFAWFKWFRAEVGEGGWLRWPARAVVEPREQLEQGASEPDTGATVTQLDPPEDQGVK
jgi:hypothetical protein